MSQFPEPMAPTPNGDKIRSSLAEAWRALDEFENRAVEYLAAAPVQSGMSELECKIRGRIAELQGHYEDAMQRGNAEAAAANLTRLAELKSLLGEFV